MDGSTPTRNQLEGEISMKLLKSIMYIEAGSVMTWAWMMGHTYIMGVTMMLLIPFIAMDLVAVITPWDLEIFRPFTDFGEEKSSSDTDQSNH